MTDQYNYQYGGEQPQYQPQQQPLTPEQDHRQKQDAQQQAERERNAAAQQLGDERPVDMGQIDEMVRAGYANVDQPGLDPRNAPSDHIEAKMTGQRPWHKSTRDLEDITGNPGHRGVSPYAPATSFNRAPRADGFMDSINEPEPRT